MTAKPRVFCVAAVFGELGQGGWLATGPWVAAMPEIAAGQFVNGFMISNKVTLPLNAIAVSEIPVDQIRQWVKELDQIDAQAGKAEAERVVRWPKEVWDGQQNVPSSQPPPGAWPIETPPEGAA